MFDKIISFVKEFFTGKMEIPEEIVPHENTKEVPSYTKTELNKMTKGKLVDLAKNEFDLSLDIKLKKPEIIEELLNAQK